MAAGKLTEPELQPTASGKWMVSTEGTEPAPFDLATEITKDTEICWVQ